MTTKPVKRLNEHNRGYTASTTPYRPYKMILLKKCDNRIEARKMEKYFKSGFGRNLLDKMLAGFDVSKHINDIVDMTSD